MQRREGLGGLVARLVGQRRQEQDLHPIALPAVRHGELVDALQDRQRQLRPLLLQQQPHVGQVLDVALVLGRHVRIEIAAVGPALGQGQPVRAQPEAGLLGTGIAHQLQRAQLVGEADGPLDLVEGLLPLPLRPHHPRQRHPDPGTPCERLRGLGPLIRAVERAPGVIQQSPLQINATEFIQCRLRPDLDGFGARGSDHLPTQHRRFQQPPLLHQDGGGMRHFERSEPGAPRGIDQCPHVGKRGFGRLRLAVMEVTDTEGHQGEDALGRSIRWQVVERPLRIVNRPAVVQIPEVAGRMPEEHQPFTHAIAIRRPHLFGAAQ